MVIAMTDKLATILEVLTIIISTIAVITVLIRESKLKNSMFDRTIIGFVLALGLPPIIALIIFLIRNCYC